MPPLPIAPVPSLSLQALPPLISYTDLIAIILTALGAILAALGIGLAVAAVWGWSEIKSGAARAAEAAIETKMAQYPAPETMMELVSRMQDILGAWDDIQNKVVTDSGTNQLAGTSNSTVQEIAPPYPKGEAKSGDDHPKSDPPKPEPRTSSG